MLGSRARRTLWSAMAWLHSRRRRVRVGRGSVIAPNAVIDPSRGGAISIGERVRIEWGALLSAEGGTISIGAESTVNPYCVIYGHGGVAIGKSVRIATHT